MSSSWHGLAALRWHCFAGVTENDHAKHHAHEFGQTLDGVGSAWFYREMTMTCEICDLLVLDLTFAHFPYLGHVY